MAVLPPKTKNISALTALPVPTNFISMSIKKQGSLVPTAKLPSKGLNFRAAALSFAPAVKNFNIQPLYLTIM